MSSELAALVMAQVATNEPDLSALTNSPQKRKRPGETSPDLRRSKRAGMNSPDPADAYANTDMDTAHAAAAGVNVSDFDALQQAAAGTDHTDAADPANASSTAAAALVYPTIHAPQPTEDNFAAQISGEQENHQTLVPYTHDVSQTDGLPMDHQALANATAVVQSPDGGMHQDMPGTRYSTTPNPKPAVGSEEWHKMRKDNHKEVERRRRETINEGINELAKIVPGCEKNKGSILQNAVRYITKLKEDEQQAIEKWTLEKLLTEQAIAELSTSNDKLKHELDRLYQENEMLKRIIQGAGLSLDAIQNEDGSGQNGGQKP